MGDRMNLEKLRIAFATPEYVTENHFDGGWPITSIEFREHWSNSAMTFMS
jgi:hypothetical protein